MKCMVLIRVQFKNLSLEIRFAFDEELDKWAFTLNPCLSMFHSEAVKQVLIATLDSIIQLPFVK